MRGYISCAVDCPYEGAVAPAAVASVSARLAAMGCTEVSLGDTMTGTFAALGAMIAVHARASTGRGQVVDAAICSRRSAVWAASHARPAR